MKKCGGVSAVIVLAAVGGMFLFSCGAGGGGAFTGSLSYSWYTPTEEEGGDYADGYYEGSITFGVEGGTFTDSDTALKYYETDGGEPWSMVNTYTDFTGTKGARDLFGGITGMTMYVGDTETFASKGNAPTSAPRTAEYTYAECAISYDGGKLEEIVFAHIGGTTRFFWEYYPDGNGKVMRIDGGDGKYDEAQYYLYDDENFPTMPTEMYYFATEEEFEEGYDYSDEILTIPNSDDNEWTYTPDGLGRVAEMIEERYGEGWMPDSKMIFTYTDATEYFTKIERYSWDGEGWESEPALVIDFVTDADSGFELSYMMFQPWQFLMLPFINQNDLFYCWVKGD